MTYNQQLRDPRWQRKRLEVFNAAGWQRGKCRNKHRSLHVHHLVYRSVPPWEYLLNELEALCDECHRQAHVFLRGKGHFSTRQPYTRQQIQKVLGGTTTGFLPVNAGHVVCGCFRREYNPDAPDILLPGDLQRIIEPAERFCHQSFPIPIFVYETSHSAWFYERGRF